MGFSHEKTKHHFRLYGDGGAIEVETIDPNDTASRDQSRSHWWHISRMFALGDVNAPMLIHDQTLTTELWLKRLSERFEPATAGRSFPTLAGVADCVSDPLGTLNVLSRFPSPLEQRRALAFGEGSLTHPAA